MLVYGDHCSSAEAGERARAINRQLDRIVEMGAGLQRHSALIGALVDGGQLLQGLADRLFDNADADGPSAELDRLSNDLRAIGGAVCRSWDSGYAEIGELPSVDEQLRCDVELRLPEGFAFYGVYPEAYIDAARRLTLQAPARVIGIRSIGTSLAAVVAAALQAPPPVTVRPFGDPLDRRIALDADLERALLEADVHYVVVDEGPGLSGSSFGAVVDWLRDRSVPLARIALLTSHASEPGSAATEERRRWWRQCQRTVGDFDERWPALVGQWCSSLVGELEEPPREISGGAWRRFFHAHESDWPVAVPAWERRKFLIRADGETFLAKFAGLSRIGEDKLALAERLHSEILTPEPVGLAHGFLLERWCGDAAPLREGDRPVGEVGHYIGLRARLLPAPGDSGADVAALLAMIRRNTEVEFGDRFGAALDEIASSAGTLEGRVVRVRTDNKLDRHEWLLAPGGALIKTDALDHHKAHDLIGCQDMAWDCAGAISEFGLDSDQAEALIDAAEYWAGRTVDRQLLQFLRIAYAAFRLGQMRLASAAVFDRLEQARLAPRGDRYAAEVEHLLESSRAATRLASLVG